MYVVINMSVDGWSELLPFSLSWQKNEQFFFVSLYSNQESKGLLYGSLMCISLDKTFNSPIWATVGSFPKERLRDSNTRSVEERKIFSDDKFPDKLM